MSKQNPDLVIVESPSKAKTIGKYLGSDYQVKACMGHLRDLPKSTMGVDLEHDFAPEYIPMKEKAELIRELKKAADKADTVYLATDPDREGEAISWHIKELLKLPDDKTRRVTFNEITKGVVTRAIQQPRDIDLDLVDAQQARRILDRIVGYQLSPLLWRKVRRGLSAGRVQSVATRLVVERENEIRAFVPEEYWSLDVTLECVEKPGRFEAHYHGENGKKRSLGSEEETVAVLSDVQGQRFSVKEIKKAEKRRSPAPPFITSTLQQEASRKLNMTPKRTMAIAQQLYEGVEITEPPALQDQGRGPGRPRGHSAQRRPPGPGLPGKGSVPGPASALSADLEPLRSQPNGQCRLRHRRDRHGMQRPYLPLQPSEFALLRLPGRL